MTSWNSLPERSFNVTGRLDGSAHVSCGALSGALKIRVGMIEPILPDGAEQIELERVVERLRLMLHPGRDVKDFALANRDLLAVDQELEGALQHVGHLLALVGVHRHERTLLEVDLREHLPLPGDDLAGDHFRHFFQRYFIPAMEADSGRG